MNKHLAEFVDMMDKEWLSIIPNVGYPNPNTSWENIPFVLVDVFAGGGGMKRESGASMFFVVGGDAFTGYCESDPGNLMVFEPIGTVSAATYRSMLRRLHEQSSVW